jgi:ankyrin repeat protein
MGNSESTPDPSVFDCFVCSPNEKLKEPQIKPPNRKKLKIDLILTAASEGNMNALPSLIKENPELVSEARTAGGNLAIHFAAAGGHVAALDCLFKASAHTLYFLTDNSHF